jgi:hypothetical protein
MIRTNDHLCAAHLVASGFPLQWVELDNPDANVDYRAKSNPDSVVFVFADESANSLSRWLKAIVSLSKEAQIFYDREIERCNERLQEAKEMKRQIDDMEQSQEHLSALEQARKEHPPSNYVCQVAVTEDGHDHDASGPSDDPTPTRPCCKSGAFLTIVYNSDRQTSLQVYCLEHRDAMAAWINDDRSTWGVYGPSVYEGLIPKNEDTA